MALMKTSENFIRNFRFNMADKTSIDVNLATEA